MEPTDITKTKLQQERELVSYFVSLPTKNRAERRRACRAVRMPMVAGKQKPVVNKK